MLVLLLCFSSCPLSRMNAWESELTNFSKIIEYTFSTFLLSGYGVFCLKSFSKGSFLLQYNGELIPEEEGERRSIIYEHENQGCYLYYFRYANKNMWYDYLSVSLNSFLYYYDDSRWCSELFLLHPDYG